MRPATPWTLVALLGLLLLTAACTPADDDDASGDDDDATGDDDDATGDDDDATGDDDDATGDDDDDTTAPPSIHDPFDGLLGQFTSMNGDGHALMDYDALAGDTGALGELADYLAALDAADPSALADTDERLAFWLNAYNASVVDGVLAAYGGDHGFSVLDSGVFFDDTRYSVAGTTLSLNQLEHGIVRSKLDHPAVTSADPAVQDAIATFTADLWDGALLDARVHVGLNCASIGCPNLRGPSPPFAYYADSLDDQLTAASRAYCDHASKGAGPDGISRIFQWFSGDFVPEYGDAAGFIETYRTDGLDGVDAGSWLDYDWALNIAP